MTCLRSVPSSDSLESGRSNLFKSDLDDDAHAVAGFGDSLKSRRLHSILDSLHAMGVQSDVDLPQFVVIGSRSAGKSSFVEAITGIRLPKASGTRCPIECLLRHSSDPWVCTVTICFIKATGGQAPEQATNIAFGDPITNRDEVEGRLRRAQQAILNPSRHYEDFLGEGGVNMEMSEVSFSENCILIQISGPDLSDLSVCDLPGVTTVNPRIKKGKKKYKTPEDVVFLDNLSIRYIEEPSCLILLMVSCETNIADQGAVDLARKYDPEGRRTIGVLTKPDKIELGTSDIGILIGYLKNELRPLELGWFCVKQPDPAQVEQGITWTEARKAENEFFGSGELWSDLSPQTLGTRQLLMCLSNILSDLIAKSLRELVNEVQELLQRTEQSLGEIPVPNSSNALDEAVQCISDFSSDVSRLVEGAPGMDGLIQSIRGRQDEFRNGILRLAPNLRPYKKDSVVVDLPRMNFVPNEEADGINSQGVVMHIDEVMELVRQAETRELPGRVPTEVFEQVKKRSDVTREHLDWLLHLERRPFTLDSHQLSTYKDKFLAYYKSCRQVDQNGVVMKRIQGHLEWSGFGNPLNDVLIGLEKLGISGVTAQDLTKLLPMDPYEPALDIMATARAYLQVSCGRFVDIVSLAVDYDFIQGIGRNMQSALYKSIIHGTGNAHQQFQALLEETPFASSQRKNLQRTRKRLEEAKVELMEMVSC
ncbi:hypothetical protein M0805_004718 [Coniferiporia weirii]|nr:hypothetical protein M0805_004718 [Coniferiporia weirii]